MTIDTDIRNKLEKTAQMGAGAEIGVAAAKGAGDAGMDLAKGYAGLTGDALKYLILLGLGVPTAGGVVAGLAASRLGDPSADDMKKIENARVNAIVDRASARLDRQLEVADKKRKRDQLAAAPARSLRLD